MEQRLAVAQSSAMVSSRLARACASPQAHYSIPLKEDLMASRRPTEPRPTEPRRATSEEKAPPPAPVAAPRAPAKAAAAPRVRKKAAKAPAQPVTVSEDVRRGMIAEGAYLRAERRGFVSG